MGFALLSIKYSFAGCLASQPHYWLEWYFDWLPKSESVYLFTDVGIGLQIINVLVDLVLCTILLIAGMASAPYAHLSPYH